MRSGDLVVISSYAPLFARASTWRWAPDLIWFDNMRVYGTPSYYMQSLFSNNRPDRVVPVTVAGPTVTLPPLPAREVATYGAPPLTPYKPESIPALFVAAGLLDREHVASGGGAGEIVIFAANPYAEVRAAAIDLRGAAPVATGARAIVLTSATADDENSFEAPAKVAPRETTVTVAGPDLTRVFPANSLTVLRLPLAP